MLISFEEDKILQNQTVHVREEETPERILRRIHDGFSADVETCIHKNGTSSALVKAPQQSVKPPVTVFIHGLNPGRIIDMGYRRNAGARNGDTHAQIRVLHPGSVFSVERGQQMFPYWSHEKHIRTFRAWRHIKHFMGELL